MRGDHSGGSSGGGSWIAAAADGSSSHSNSSKYARYTSEQLEVLEQVYNECPKPSSVRRQQLVKEAPVLANIAPKQLKVWFQNRRCREKQRKETTRLHGLNAKLTALNKILVENNDHLTRQSIQLISQKHSLRKYLYGDCGHKPCSTAAQEPTAPQLQLPSFQNLSLDHAPLGLLASADEALAEFLGKATGTSVDWIQLLGMKPGPDSFGILAVSHGCEGVAARALGLIALEATRIVEILKDKTSWLWDCRRMDVVQVFSVENGGIVEILHTEFYAPTTLAPPRDFCTLRYTTSLEDGNFVVCERSISGGLACTPETQYFLRGDVLTSGYMVRPCEGGNCIVYIIDHLDLKPCSVSEVIRPLYRSSALIAQRMTLKALRYLKHMAQEYAGEVALANGQQPGVLRSLTHRMARGFNDAVNGFVDDGWCSLGSDGLDNVALSINATINFSSPKLQSERLSSLAGTLCAKASMLLQNIHPSYLIRFLRDHRAEWAGCNLDIFQETTSGLSRGHGKRQAHVPLFQTTKEDFLEAVILEGHYSSEDGAVLSRELYLLQLCSGMEDDAVGGGAQLIFAPVDANLSEDMPLLSSGFRILPLCDNVDDEILQHDGDQGPTSSSSGNSSARCTRSILTIAFQFMYEVGTQDNVAELARNYIRNVMGFVQRVAMSLASSSAGSPSAVPAAMVSANATLVHNILQSYSANLGVDIVSCVSEKQSAVTAFWNYEAAIICCSMKAAPEFVIANQSGLEMLQATAEELTAVAWEQTMGYALNSVLVDFHEDYCQLPEASFVSCKGRRVCYKRGVLWRLYSAGQQHLAFMLIGWTFA